MPGSVRIALKAAGGNRRELEKVIGYYSRNHTDSMKLRAAYFLISNMPGKYYYEGEILDAYSKYLRLIGPYQDRNTIILDSISGIYGPMSVSRLEIKEDLKELKAEFLINNIDMAFKVWQEQPWGKDISFDQFCEYILPYRVGNERPEYDRAMICRQYENLLDKVLSPNCTSVAACSAVNDELIRNGWLQTSELSSFPDFTVNDLLVNRKGSCHEMVGLTIYILRALGIPVASDFTPQWGNRSLGHEWNVVLDKNGRNEVFMGVNSNPGVKHLFDYKKPSVIYRKTYARQTQSLALKKRKNIEVPPFFGNQFMINVSEEYYNNHEIIMRLERGNTKGNRYIYLCVFNNIDWVPVSWGKILHNEVKFTKLSGNIVYLPSYYIQGKVIPASAPFKITPDGNTVFLKAEKSCLNNLVLVRKYPFPWFAGNMAGGKFQASDFSDFRNLTDLYKISENDSSTSWQEILLKSPGSFRYYRYLGPGGSRGNIAELEFYSGSARVRGALITGSKLEFKPKENIEDGNILTYFESNKVDGGWVGTDFGKKVSITRIRYMPRTDDNSVVKGEMYELVYWDNSQWISAGIQTAERDNYLMYRDIPSGALYLLHNLTKGKEERIFTYENGKQVWW